MKRFTIDFETATWFENETFVWAWAICEIGNEENLKVGNNIESFIDECLNNKNSIFYAHNLKFDGEFIIYWALKNGFKHVQKRKDIDNMTFTTLINEMGQFYEITLYFEKKNKTVKKLTFIDSLKIIPFSVKEIAKAFNLKEQKGEIDYKKEREKNHILTEEEREYIKNDVVIVSKALNVLFSEKLDRMTEGSNALHNYKEILGKSKFEHFFPKLEFEIDSDLRESYRRRLYLFKPYLQGGRCRYWYSIRC